MADKKVKSAKSSVETKPESNAAAKKAVAKPVIKKAAAKPMTKKNEAAVKTAPAGKKLKPATGKKTATPVKAAKPATGKKAAPPVKAAKAAAGKKAAPPVKAAKAAAKAEPAKAQVKTALKSTSSEKTAPEKIKNAAAKKPAVAAPEKNAAPAVKKTTAPKTKTAKFVPARPVKSVDPLSFRGDKKHRYEMLLDLREQVAGQIRNLGAASLKSNRQAGEELADIGSDDFIRETELALMSSEAEQLNMIDDAIERLKIGRYGACEDCGCKIPPARLDAKPFAKLCVTCKEIRERNSY